VRPHLAAFGSKRKCREPRMFADEHARTLSKYRVKLSDELADDSKAVLKWSLAKIEGLVDETRRLAQENMSLWRRVGKPNRRKGISNQATVKVRGTRQLAWRSVAHIQSCSHPAGWVEQKGAAGCKRDGRKNLAQTYCCIWGKKWFYRVHQRR
jgi:hypothetical protein